MSVKKRTSKNNIRKNTSGNLIKKSVTKKLETKKAAVKKNVTRKTTTKKTSLFTNSVNRGVIGIIGGTGIYNFDGVEIIKEHKIKTPYGDPSDNVIETLVDGVTCFFLPRHGRNHLILPSEVNYAANIFALKSLGVKYIVSVSAVGSLKYEYAPGDFVLPDQFIDWTKGFRRRTFFGDGVVGHVSTALPVEKCLQKIITETCRELNIVHHVGGSYVCIEGPQFSSKAESNIYRSFGAGVIGMTNVPESYLAKEAGIAYSTVAMVTDYDCWKDEHCTLEEIQKVAAKNNLTARKLLLRLVPIIGKNPPAFTPENTFAIMTAQEKISKEKLQIIEVLLS